MNRDLLVEENRKARTMTVDGDVGQVVLMQPTVDEKTAATVYKNDFSDSDMEVFVDVGPASSSRKSATVRMLTQVLPLVPDPESQQVIASMIMYNMEGEGIQDVRKWFRTKLLNLGVVTPTKEEQIILDQQAQMATDQPPDPNVIFLQASAQKAQAEAQKTQVGAALDAAKIEQVKADTAKTIVEAQKIQQDAAMDVLDKLGSAVTATDQPTQMVENDGEQYAD
jgi:hypothetical protein